MIGTRHSRTFTKQQNDPHLISSMVSEIIQSLNWEGICSYLDSPESPARPNWGLKIADGDESISLAHRESIEKGTVEELMSEIDAGKFPGFYKLQRGLNGTESDLGYLRKVALDFCNKGLKKGFGGEIKLYVRHLENPRSLDDCARFKIRVPPVSERGFLEIPVVSLVWPLNHLPTRKEMIPTPTLFDPILKVMSGSEFVETS